MKLKKSFTGFRSEALARLQSAPFLRSAEYRLAIEQGQPDDLSPHAAHFLRTFYKEMRRYNLPFVAWVHLEGCYCELVHPVVETLTPFEVEVIDALMRNVARVWKAPVEVVDIHPLQFSLPSLISSGPFMALIEGCSQMMSKAEMAAVKADFELHVSLLMRQEKLKRPAAIMAAWLQGPMGLEKRLGGLPFEAPADKADSDAGEPAKK